MLKLIFMLIFVSIFPVTSYATNTQLMDANSISKDIEYNCKLKSIKGTKDLCVLAAIQLSNDQLQNALASISSKGDYEDLIFISNKTCQTFMTTSVSNYSEALIKKLISRQYCKYTIYQSVFNSIVIN